MPTNLYAASTDLAARAPGIMPLNPDGTLPAASQAAGDALIEAISRAIDSKTRRKPGAFMPSPSSPSPLVVYGDNKYCLELPEHVIGSITTVTTITGMTAPSWVEIRGSICTVDSTGVLSRLDKWRDGVPYTVTARWGYDTTPADIREATLVWAAMRARLNAGDMSGAVTTILRDGSTLMRDDVPPAVKDLLAPYILPEKEIEDDQKGLLEYGDIRSDDDSPHEPWMDPFRRGW